MAEGRATMDFFESQAAALRRTSLLVFLFVLAVILIIAALHVLISIAIGAFFRGEQETLYQSISTYAFDSQTLLYVAGLTVLVVIGGTLGKVIELREGGSAVAYLLGGVPVPLDTTDANERKLLNVVDEMSLASGVPPPSVFIMRRENGINAFAAGFSQTDAAVGVTRGAVELLSRDELQGVIAHEFSHIVNGDTRLNIRLMGIVHGILLIGLAGMTMLQIVGQGALFAGAARGPRRGSDREGAGGGWVILFVLAVGLILLVVGYIGVFFGKLIKAAVSRQREFLADAAAVQYTRNPEGLAGALRKIGGLSDHGRVRNKHSEEASHMFFSPLQKLGGGLSTHPPLPRRIKEILPAWDGTFPAIKPPEPEKERFGQQDEPPTPEPPASPIPKPGQQPDVSSPQGMLGTAILGEAIQQGQQQHPRTQPPGAGSGGAGTAASQAVDTIGQIQPAALEYAENILQQIPQDLRRRTRQAAEVTALVFALSISGRKEDQEKEMSFLEEKITERLLAKVNECLELLEPLDARVRLPLLELSVPALRQLSESEKEGFLGVYRGLMEADEEVHLFEFAIERFLSASMEQQPAPAPQYYSMRALSDPISLLLSAIAWSGARQEEAAGECFESGRKVLRAVEHELDFRARERCDLESVGAAIDRLALASPHMKKQIITACAECILADETVLVSEAELLRAVAASLDCPMPPLV